MSMFKPQSANTPKDYMSQIDEPRKSDIKTLFKFLKKTMPGLEPYVSHNIIGFGKYRYSTKSGRKGEWFVAGLASQKSYISVYICMADTGKYISEKYADQLGKVNVGRSCIRFKKLEDINLEILEKALKEATCIYKKLTADNPIIKLS